MGPGYWPSVVIPPGFVHGLAEDGTGGWPPPLYSAGRQRGGRQRHRRVKMRRGMILIAGLLMASTAMPPAANARPFLLKMLHGLTSPLGALAGGGRHASRRAHHSRPRATASRRAPAAIAAAPAAAIAGTAAATGSAPSETATTPGSPPVQASNAPDD